MMVDQSYNIEWSDIITSALMVLLIILGALALIWLAKRLIRRMITGHLSRIREETTEQRAVRTDMLSKIITKLTVSAIAIIAFLVILSVLGINITPFLAVFLAMAIGIGLALQNIGRDYVHGVYIIGEDWFRIGEWTTLAGKSGTVDYMDLRRTILRDLDGTMHVIPNSSIEIVSNMARDWASINLNITVAYKENLDHVIEVINDVCQKFKNDNVWGRELLSTPKVQRVNDLGNSGIEIKILGDTKPLRQWDLTGELRKRLKDRFDQEDIEIPWPHTKVYFGNAPTGVES
jgi:small-conductance mechanosensitive channel